jgi:hypothetical protein
LLSLATSTEGGSVSVSCWGTITVEHEQGNKMVRLANGDLVTVQTHKKRSFTFDIKVISFLDLQKLLAYSRNTWVASQGSVEVSFVISSKIHYVEYQRFPGYFSCTFSGEEP